MDYNNDFISNLLLDVALAYEGKPEYRSETENKYRVLRLKALSNQIRQLQESIYSFYLDSGKIPKLSGMGKRTEDRLKELFNTGHVVHYDEIMKGLSQFYFILSRIITPVKAYKIIELYPEIESFEEFNSLLNSGQLNISASMKKEITKEVNEYLESINSPKIYLFDEINPIAIELKNYIETSKSVKRIKIAGSIRRGKPVIGDIDIAIESTDLIKTKEHIINHPQVVEIVSSGFNWQQFKLSNGVFVDCRMTTEKSREYTSLLHHLTGSKQHNVLLREHARTLNLSISEHGIKNLIDGSVFKPQSEQEMYNFLELNYIPPELRNETATEFEYNEYIPKELIKLEDLRGDFHLHSSFNIQSSHDYGNASVIQIAKMAKKLDYDYIAITDHNPKQSLNEDEMIKLLNERQNEIDSAEEETGIRIFSSLEIDIKVDGSLAVSNRVLKELDFAIVGVHSAFDLDRETMTRRIIRGLDHPEVKILVHPTGRKLPNKRKQINADWNEIFKFCRENDKIIEINSSEDRIDLPYNLIFDALKLGNIFSINSDAHSLIEMNNQKNGIMNARRGWCQIDDIINTYNLEDVEKILLR
jgi:DNA polymerase (family 10)